jgi:hypothetical protein
LAFVPLLPVLATVVETVIPVKDDPVLVDTIVSTTELPEIPLLSVPDGAL